MFLKIGQRPDHGFDRPLGLLSDCHRRIEHFLATLVTIAHDVRGGALTESQRAQLDAALTYFSVAGPRHTADEEESLFPRLRESGNQEASRALEMVDRLQHDHDTADEHHRVVDDLGRRWLAQGTLTPRDADDLSTRLVSLQRIYASHIEAEDSVLFPLAGRLLSEEQIRAIGIEMEARRKR